MAIEYSAEIHDWDLTLRAAADLIQAGLIADTQPRRGSVSSGFSFFTGGMLLTFAAVESFSASIAFLMKSDNRFVGFDFNKYKKAWPFWVKMGLLTAAAGIKMDRSTGLFAEIERMQKWRNLVTHASPYAIERIEIEDTLNTPQMLHANYRQYEYAWTVGSGEAQKFYQSALSFVEFLERETGLTPRATATYSL